MLFFSQCFVESFFFFFFPYFLKSFFPQTDYGPVFLCDARICSRVHIRGTRWCWRYRGDGAFFSFFLSNTHDDRGRGVIKAACGNETKVDDLLLLLFYFFFSLSNDTKAKYHLVASMPHPLDDRMLCPWTCFTFDVVQQAEQNSLSGETGFHCRNSWNQFT